MASSDLDELEVVHKYTWLIASYNLLSICLVTDYSLGIVCWAREVES